ncbi:MAG: kynureninase [Planctomycetota bacterium]|jgi:kynureninase
MTIDLNQCLEMDQSDPLADCADRFELPEGVIYLDGNSLGAMPKTTAVRISKTLHQEWAQDLIGAWNSAGWMELTQTLGDRIGGLVGAAPGQIVVCDNTSINLYKALHAAASLEHSARRIICLKNEFPTDRYIVESVTATLGEDWQSLQVDDDQLLTILAEAPAILLLSQVNFQSGAVLDMAEITRACHASGSLVIWDLCHSAGAMAVELDACNADFAVGCSYKYLNGGPGAPAFLYAAKRHQQSVAQPLSGWWSHAEPFAFAPDYQPANDIRRFLTGTQPILSMQAVSTGLDSFDQVPMALLREKSIALCELFIQLVKQECEEYGLQLIGDEQRQGYGSQVSYRFEQGYPLMQALIDRGVIGDFRAPDITRFGFAPLYIGYEQVWQAVQCLKRCLQDELWSKPRYQIQQTVT